MIVRLRVACLACGRGVGAIACPLCESLDIAEAAAGGRLSPQLEYVADTGTPPPPQPRGNPNDANH